MKPLPGQRPWPVVLLAAAALLLAAVAGAYLVFQPSASTATTAVHRVARLLADLGLSIQEARGVVGFALNVALFVPGAFAAALLWPRVRWWQWVLVGFAVSASIETVQGLFLPGRQAEVRDLVSNTVGGALGAGLAILLRRRRNRVVRR